jgi:hypothetical protein
MTLASIEHLVDDQQTVWSVHWVAFEINYSTIVNKSNKHLLKTIGHTLKRLIE